MEVKIISTGDPFVLISIIPASWDGSRSEREHEAGIHLLKVAMEMLGILMPGIEYDIFGKPFFKDDIGYYFSITHSLEYVACAISKQEIGCDIEKIRKVPSGLDNELEKVRYLTTVSDIKSPLSRTIVWTAYEAIAKCLGFGIPLGTCDVQKYVWDIKTHQVCEDYILSIALKNRNSVSGSR